MVRFGLLPAQQTIDSPLTAHNAKIAQQQGLEFYTTWVPKLPRIMGEYSITGPIIEKIKMGQGAEKDMTKDHRKR